MSVAEPPALTPARRRALRDGAILAGLIFNLVLVFVWGPKLDLLIDAGSWWSIDLSHLYASAETSLTADDAFRLAPVFAWLMLPLTWLPWNAFAATFVGLNVAAVAVLVRRKTLVFILAFPPVLLELINGNIHLLMAVAIWAAFRWPAAWAFLLLSKVTPGVGVLWYLGRGEWRNLAIALGATAAVVLVGTVVAPDLWVEWFRSLVISAGHPLPVRCRPWRSGSRLLLRSPFGRGARAERGSSLSRALSRCRPSGSRALRS